MNFNVEPPKQIIPDGIVECFINLKWLKQDI